MGEQEVPTGRGKRRLGVMGGTFDPIHHGHLVAASEVAAQFHLDEVVFVPTGQPWQKSHKHVSPAEDRYLMTVIATRPTRSSRSAAATSTASPHVHDRHPAGPARGPRRRGPLLHHRRDALAQILTWRDADELFSLSHFIGVTRPGHVLTDDGLPKGGASPWWRSPALAISSTDCRARVAQGGEPVWYLVPDGVVRYIDKRQLYRGE